MFKDEQLWYIRARFFPPQGRRWWEAHCPAWCQPCRNACAAGDAALSAAPSSTISTSPPFTGQTQRAKLWVLVIQKIAEALLEKYAAYRNLTNKQEVRISLQTRDSEVTTFIACVCLCSHKTVKFQSVALQCQFSRA